MRTVRAGDVPLFAATAAKSHRFDDRARRGQQIFTKTGCASCHTPPLYTNNRITPADGFAVPADHVQRYAVLNVRVGTDPTLTMQSRRGTGYYKIPSLRGVWYRGPFEHTGSVATLVGSIRDGSGTITCPPATAGSGLRVGR
jgi:cytochrome c peroxidase